MMRRLVARHGARCRSPPSSTSGARSSPPSPACRRPSTSPSTSRSTPERMRDLARFYFGFSVERRAHAGRGGGDRPRRRDRRSRPRSRATSRRGRAPGGAALDRGDGAADHGAAALHPGSRDRPADLPAFVISPPLSRSDAARTRSLAAADGRPRRRITVPSARPSLANAGDAGRAAGVLRRGWQLARADSGRSSRSAASSAASLDRGRRRRFTEPQCRRRRRTMSSHPAPIARAARRRPRHRALCAGPLAGRRRQPASQALLERDAARPEPGGGRGLSRRAELRCSSIRTARRPRSARRSPAPTA